LSEISAQYTKNEGKMQSCQVQSPFETAAMGVQSYFCANSNDTEQQVSLAIQPLQTFAMMSDDGVQDVFNSQPDIACHSPCNWDIGMKSSTVDVITQQYLEDLEDVIKSQNVLLEDDNLYTFSSLHGNHTQAENALPQDLQDDNLYTFSSSTFSSHPRTASTQDDSLYTFSSLHGNHIQAENTLPQDLQDDNLYTLQGSSTISSSTFSSHPRTASTQDDNLYTFSSLHGNHTQTENTLPQDLQNKAKIKLENIIKMYEKIKVCAIKCSPMIIKKINKINGIDRCISNRVNRLIRHLASTDCERKFRFNKQHCQRSRRRIQKIMENVAVLEFTQLNGPLKKIKARNEEMIKATDEILLYHKIRRKKGRVLPQDLQDKIKEGLEDIIKVHGDMQNELLDCKKKILSQHYPTRQSFDKINGFISSRARRIIQYLDNPNLDNPNYKSKFHSDKQHCHRSRHSIQKVMENATKFGLTQLDGPLKKMDTCYERMIMCIDKCIKYRPKKA